jgi:hypothetical protein
MDVVKALARKLRALIGDDNNGFYVTGSELLRVPNARVHQIPKVTAEHHRDTARRELQRALMIGRR